MRIRSIKPEFWRSDDISALDRDDRLLFIGLWSYVDDNGVGRDKLADIAADLFAHDLEQDPRETFARVSRGLLNLAERGLITRYSAVGGGYLCVTGWTEHQRIDKPGKPRYPGPEEAFATSSRDSRETLAPGTGEQGNRGTGEQSLLPPAGGDSSSFAEFYMAYPRKAGKEAARRAFEKAAKKVNPRRIVGAARTFAADPNLPEPQFIPHPATWLNAGRWDDPPLPPRAGVVPPRPEGVEDWQLR